MPLRWQPRRHRRIPQYRYQCCDKTESAAPVGDGTGVALAESAVGELITGENVGFSGSTGKAAWAAPGTCLGVPP